MNKALFRSKWFWIGTVAFLVVGGGILYASQKKTVPEMTTVQAEKQDIIQTVNETGTVVSDLSVSYGWEMAGRVVALEKKVGDPVQKGDVIARLENGTQAASLRQAQSGLQAAEANLQKELAGATDEERARYAALVSQAEATLVQAQSSLAQIIAITNSETSAAENAVITAQNNLKLVQEQGESALIADAYEDVIDSMKSSVATLGKARFEADNILGIDNTLANDEFENLLGVLDSGTKFRAESSYYAAKNALHTVERPVTTLTYASAQTTVDTLLLQTQEAVQKMQTLLYDVSILLEKTISGNDFSDSELTTLKSTINTTRGTVNTSATNLTTAKQAITTARSSLSNYQVALRDAQSHLERTRKESEQKVVQAQATVASKQAALTEAQAILDSVVSEPRDVDLAPLHAEVNRNRAIVSDRANEWRKTTLVALTDGVLSKLDIEIGEIALPNTPVITINSPGLSIDVDISESEISKIRVGDTANVTLDAFGGNKKFAAIVEYIEPAQTEISGVIYYRTKLSFVDLPENNEIKPGMTANVQIFTDSRENVVAVPARAVLSQDGKQIVRVLTNKEEGLFEERTVTTGIRADGGLIEVTSGLSGGEEVIMFIEENE